MICPIVHVVVRPRHDYVVLLLLLLMNDVLILSLDQLHRGIRL